MREFNLLDDYPKLSKPRHVGSGLRTIDHRIIATIEKKIFLMVIETMVMEALNMTEDGKKLQIKSVKNII